MNTQQVLTVKDHTVVPRILSAILAIILFASVFMPYSTATEKYKDVIKYIPDEITQDRIGLDSDDIINVSMVEYAKVYAENSDEYFDDEFFGFFYVFIAGFVALFSLLCLIAALTKKPILLIILDILLILALAVQCWDYADRGVIPSRSYDWGFGFYVSFVCVGLIFIFAIWLFAAKIKNKKEIALATQAAYFNAPPTYQTQPSIPYAPNQNVSSSSEWICSCGNKTSNNFCANCGSPKQTAPAGWTCTCGNINTGNFCSKCGNPKNI